MERTINEKYGIQNYKFVFNKKYIMNDYIKKNQCVMRRDINLMSQLNNTCDGLGLRVDLRMRPILYRFWEAGIQTSASCEGHLDHGCPYPWIDVPNHDDGHKLRSIIKSWTRVSNLKIYVRDYGLQGVGFSRLMVVGPKGARLSSKRLHLLEFSKWLIKREQ